MSRQQKLYLTIAISAVLTGLVLTKYYRPYVYINHLNDLGIADTIGSFVSVIACCFFMWGIKNDSDSQKNKQILIVTIIYGLVWESSGLIGLHGTFDWKDIIAATLSGILTYFIKELVNKQSRIHNTCRNKNQKNVYGGERNKRDQFDNI